MATRASVEPLSTAVAVPMPPAVPSVSARASIDSTAGGNGFPAASPSTSHADTASMHRARASAFEDFAKRDSVKNIRGEIEGGHVRNLFKPHTIVHVFQEQPSVTVLGGRSEEVWPTRYVEYDVEVKYKTFTWQVEIAKSTIYGLFFFVKSRMHGVWNASANTDSLHATWNFPQIRRLFLANAEKSIRPDMVALVQQYLDAVVKIPALLQTSYVTEMLQVSCSTFDEVEGHTSMREGWLRVRMWPKGNRENVRINRSVLTCDNDLFNCMCVIKRVNFRAKHWRWVSLRQACLAIYPSITEKCASQCFLFDDKFCIERGVQSAGSSTGLLVSNSTYVMQLEAKTKPVILKWANDIRKAAESSAWAHSHRDGSFAIPRNPSQFPSYAKWFVDGNDAYASIYDALLAARKEIFIAGWWICPTIHLLRPAGLAPQSRLDYVLKQKAEEGVKVYILMYKEVSVALTLNSLFSKLALRDLHDNIFVLRDPDFLMKHWGMWSHHEKIVSIDQQVSFVGGLDLCFGRWDTPEHALFDGASQLTNFVGKDYSNPRVKDFIEVHLPDKDLIDRNEVPRMPWHDCHCRLEGQPARDVARHFIQRWNYSVSTRKKDSKIHHLVPMNDYPRLPEKKTGDSASLLTRRLQRAVRAVRAVRNLRKMSLARLKEANSSSRLSIGATPASPSNGLSPRRASDYRSEALSSSSPLHIEADSDSVGTPPSSPSSPTSPSSAFANRCRLVDHAQDAAALQAKRGYQASCHIVRSLSPWSGGCPTESSIQNAYIRLINSARHFIYIENQFFVSGLDGDPLCSNRIANAILERIRRAARNHEMFRVMVVMPLLPAFPGKVEDKEASSLRGVMHWQYRTICRGDNTGLYPLLFKEVDNPFDYLAFYGLRTHTMHHKPPQTEQVYVHSKVMIVDDRSCIIGSANINDRSMAGDRDSEIAVVVEDTELDENTKIANGTYSVGKFAHSFRMQLFREHFGVEPDTPEYRMYEDPVNVDSWLSMEDHGMKNSIIYERVFDCLPSDKVRTIRQANQRVQRRVSPMVSPASSHPSPRRALSTRATSVTEHTFDLPGACSPVADDEDGVHADQVEPQLDKKDAAEEPEQSPSPKFPPTDELDPNSSPDQDERSEFFRGATLNMHEDAQIEHHQSELNEICGHIVYFPLKFLCDDMLEPKLLPPALFQ